MNSLRLRPTLSRARLLSVIALVLLVGVSALAVAVPPGGSGSPGGAGTPGTASGGAPGAGGPGGNGSANGPPATAQGFMCPTCTNFVRPSDGWGNWSPDLPVPKGERTHSIYLCYARDNSTQDPNLPFVLRPVDMIPDSSGHDSGIPCYSVAEPKGGRPVFRGDRLRVAIYMKDAETRAFFQNLSVIDLDVVLTAMPPLSPVLLRLNLGANASPGGMGGNQAPESNTYHDPDYQCFRQILGLAGITSGSAPCAAPHDSAKDVLVLPWPYTFPADVLTDVYISGSIPATDNGGPWKPNNFYAASKIVQCPGEDECIVALGSHGILPGTVAGTSGPTEPKWLGPGIVSDGSALTWTALAVTYRVNDSAKPHAPDGKAVYQPNDLIVWNQGQQQVESNVEDWQPNHWYIANQSVVICPPDFSAAPVDHEGLCVAASSGMSGPSRPASWNHPKTADGEITWIYDQGPVDPNDVRWSSSTTYHVGDKIRCETRQQRQNLCTATQSGSSGRTEPWWPYSASAASSTAPAGGGATPTTIRDDQQVWTPFSPTAGTGTAVPSTVAAFGAERVPQTHGPSMWGLSTALLYSTHSIPSAYAFTETVSAGCPVPPSGASTAAGSSGGESGTPTSCPPYSTSYQRATDIALMVSPYVFHALYSVVSGGPRGIDAETNWSFRNPADYIPEPIVGFGLNSPGSSYYAGFSWELFVRNLQFVWGWGLVKAPYPTSPVTAAGSPPNTVTPNTYSAFAHIHFIGIAYNISGLVSGH